MSEVRGVLVDVDGTLVDSNDAHAEAWTKALQRAGYDVPYEEVRRLIGMGSDNLLKTVAGIDKSSPERKKLSDDWREIFELEYLSDLKPTPGAHDLIAELHRRGLKLVAASSAEPDLLSKLLKIAGVDRYLQEQTSAGEVQNSKPDPDIVEVALKKIALPPDQVLMLGDTPYDIELAAKAGVGVVALRCGGWDDGDLRGALAVYDDPADLLQHHDESPFGHVAQHTSRAK